MPAACAANVLARESANAATGSRSISSARLTTRSLIMLGSSMPLEILHRALVLERGCASRKRAEIAAPAGLRVLLPRIEAVLPRRKLADHGGFSLQIVPCNLCSSSHGDGDLSESMFGAAGPDELRLHERNVFCGRTVREIDTD